MKRIRQWMAGVLCAALCLSFLPAGATASTSEERTYSIDEGGFPVAAQVFLAHLTWSAGECALTAADGTPVPDDAPVATGQILRILDALNGQAEEELTVVVLGDVLGTGSASISQLSRIAQALRGAEPLTGIWLEAADLDGSGALGLSDLVQAAQEYLAVRAAEDDAFTCEVFPAFVTGVDLEFTLPLYFTDSARDIPYISSSTMEILLQALLPYEDENTSPVRLGLDGHTAVFQRPGGATAAIDCDSDTVSFDNYDAFFQSAHAATLLDTLWDVWWDEDGNPLGIERASGSYDRAGAPIAVPLGEYAIDASMQAGNCRIPLQTFADIFLAPLWTQAVYNGQCVILTSGSLDEYEALYYAAPPRTRSAELSAYNYNELCLAMDLLYGLRKQHNIQDFDALFRQTGLRSTLLSSDGAAADRALAELMDAYLADGHSILDAPSFYAGQYADITPQMIAPGAADRWLVRELFEEARDLAFPDGVPGYEEVGDTAFVTIDELSADGPDTLAVPSQPEDVRDTVSLIMYAHSQITRENTPIRNVVVDLTCSGGGVDDASIFVLGWLLGTAQIDQESALTGAQASTKYRCDVNLDGSFDDADSVQQFNRFCLISPVSFSSASLIPALLKGTQVALVGQKTGGGACVTQPISTADGTMLTISGAMRVCIEHNGSYYEADRGIEPDYPITRIENFYDRTALAAHLDALAQL